MYEVIVGNVGRVYYGRHEEYAIDTYRLYVRSSAHNDEARCFGEDVVVFLDENILCEHIGHLTHSEW